MSQRGRIITGALVALIVLSVFGLAGESDLHDEQRQLAEYCDMVSDGAWPDYQGNAAQVCSVEAARARIQDSDFAAGGR